MKYGFVYIWFDRKHKRYYIGSHWGSEDDGYICSSTWMIKAHKIRPNDFKRRILCRVYTSRQDLLEEEYQWLSLISDNDISNKKYYNRTKHKNGHWASEDYEKDIRKRISQTTKDAMQRSDVKAKLVEGYKKRNNRAGDPEVKAKRAESNRGQKRTLEQRAKMSAAQKGKKRAPLTEERKQKIRDAGYFKKINSERHQCKVCGKMVHISGLNRYHNDNCKFAGAC